MFTSSNRLRPARRLGKRT